jgi:hypothetical protein
MRQVSLRIDHDVLQKADGKTVCSTIRRRLTIGPQLNKLPRKGSAATSP